MHLKLSLLKHLDQDLITLSFPRLFKFLSDQHTCPSWAALCIPAAVLGHVLLPSDVRPPVSHTGSGLCFQGSQRGRAADQRELGLHVPLCPMPCASPLIHRAQDFPASPPAFPKTGGRHTLVFYTVGRRDRREAISSCRSPVICFWQYESLGSSSALGQVQSTVPAESQPLPGQDVSASSVSPAQQ